jgi:hypothetical protein
MNNPIIIEREKLKRGLFGKRYKSNSPQIPRQTAIRPAPKIKSLTLFNIFFIQKVYQGSNFMSELNLSIITILNKYLLYKI